MVRKLAYLLVILAVLTAVGELCGLLLPTLSWPFTVSREMSMLNIVCTDQNNGGFLTPQGKIPVVRLGLRAGHGRPRFLAHAERPPEVPSNADHQAPHPAF